jgi:uncharacterized RDD family membrane protein YckC
MERAGFGRRLGSAILDGIILSFIVTVAIVVYAAVGGTRLAFQASEALGVPVNMRTIGSEQVWEEFGREAESMVTELERQFQDDFTPEQAEFMSNVVEDAMADYFRPERISLDYVMNLGPSAVDDAIDTAFDAIIAADREDLDPAKVNALRREVKLLTDRFAIGQIVPRAIRFAVWVVLIPAIVLLAYGFLEAIWGRTLGKLMFQIRIDRAGDDEGSVAANRLLRYAVKYSPVLLAMLAVLTRLPFLVGVAGIAWVVVLFGSLTMLGRDKRAMHDYVAGTAVYMT